MNHHRLLSLLKGIISQPTAPFHEYHVRAEILSRLSAIPNVSWKLDPFGNVIARYKLGRNPPRWAVGVHMDHPGWVEGGGPNGKKSFLGGVPTSFLNDPANATRIRDFGPFSMWDLPPFERKDHLVCGRACDDLVGCALTLALLEDLAKAAWQGSCGAIFSRAEEVGFAGAVRVAQAWPFPATTTFLSLETSAPVGAVEIGNGPVCRVGDRLSIFDSQATSEILSAATVEKIPAQRALLDRGTCEATALQAFGIRSAGISVPLGNYHNCGPNNRIEPEFVHLTDVKNTLRLLVATITGKGRLSTPSSLKSRIRKRCRETQIFAKAAQKSWPASGAPTPQL